MKCWHCYLPEAR